MSSQLQTLIFDKNNWTLRRSKEWLRKHNFKTEVDEKENTYRFRQLNPIKGKKFRTIQLTDNVQGVVMF